MISFLDLPVYQHKQDILDALDKNQTIIVESPTGSGKTTQIPLILQEAGYDKQGIIGITQPRRIATLSVCEFIKKQIKDERAYCAYKMRFLDTSTPETRIKIMTDGILLQEVKADPTLSKYSVIMVDEAHERSLNIDFILGLLKEISQKRPELKIIISSATINTKTFSDFFSGAPIISISGHPYPVEVRYIPQKLTRDTEELYFEKIVSLVKEAHQDPNGGDVLVFLPGEADIKNCLMYLYYSDIAKSLQIYPLYGRLSKEEQDKVFTKTEKGKTKVVVSTNIAETSLTIDGIRTVIDSGMAKINFYNQQNFTSALLPMNISRASADQRKGRAGRTASGKCIRLYSEKSYQNRPEFSEEEILHSDLAEVVLRMSEIGIYNTATFPFITKPMKSALKSAEETLILIGAIEENHHLTHIGEMMIKFPLLPRLSRVIVEAIINYPAVISNVITAVAFLSTKSPYILPPGEELIARDVHHAMSNKTYGDFVSMLTLYKAYTVIVDKKEKEQFCTMHYLDMQTMDEIVNIKGQLEQIVSEEGIPLSDGGNISEYFCCLAAGLRQYVCKRVDRYSFRTTTADRIMIHPGSAWFRNTPEYILAGEIVETSKMYARTVSPLKAEWLQKIDPTILSSLNKTGFNKRKEEERFSKESKRQAKEDAKYLERFKRTINGKECYLVPIKKLFTISDRSNAKLRLCMGEYISKQTFQTRDIGKELQLLKGTREIITRKPKGYVTLEKCDSDKLLNYVSLSLKPYATKKNEFSFLGLKFNDDKYSLIPFVSLESAARETMYSLATILDTLDKSEDKIRKKCSKKLTEIEKTIDA